MKKIITSLILLFGVLSTLFAANVTLYYVNSTKWTTVNGYVWNKASDTPLVAWPGTAMTKTSETAKGFDVYSITFDGAKYDRIIFKGASQTADLTFNASKPYYYEGKWYATLAEINGADAPAELTLYYVNTTKWSKVLAYAWGGTALADWPGVAATLAGRTKDGIEVYSYTFNPAMANQIIFNNGSGSKTVDLSINAATPYFYNNNWVASFAYDPVPVEPTPVLDPIYLRGNVNAWGIDDTWKLTTTDGNYFVANYAAGSEVELSGSFKLGSGTTDWTPYNFGADIVLEAGKSYVLTAGSSSPNINTSGKIKVSKIEFTLSSQTLKITGQTVADKFDVTTDQGIALVENLDGTLQYIPLEFQANGVYTGVYTFAKSAKSMPLFKVGGTADLNTIDFGDNGTSIIRLDQPYTLKRGSSNFVAINQTDLGSQGVDNGTKFDVTVTFTEDWGVTLLLIAQKKPIDPEQPKVVISDLTAATFAETTVNETADATATFTIENATQAEAVIVEDEAGVFSVATPVIDGTAGSVVVTFAPTAAGTYTATLTITAAGVSQSVAIAATAV
ncbi:MAG: starch-binding protein, partial [Paludibacteraceae bacterium]|nr:starch-binding protein [Paludibacteraceae bacterium]